jgi:hypothetical protein
MKLIIITGPQAVGKMAVGRAIAAKSDLKLFHNHMTIDMVISIFPYATKEAQKLIRLFRKEIFESMANSDQAGLIFTYLWGFERQSDHDYVNALIDLFESKGAEVFVVELECDMNERLLRNKSPLRLQEKPSKRNVEWSESELIESAKKHRLNSLEGEIKHPNYLRINNTNLSENEVSDKIISFFNL